MVYIHLHIYIHAYNTLIITHFYSFISIFIYLFIYLFFFWGGGVIKFPILRGGGTLDIPFYVNIRCYGQAYGD